MGIKHNRLEDDIKYLFCETCGKYSKGVVEAVPVDKRKETKGSWKQLVEKQTLYFSYQMLDCIQKNHIIKSGLTINQLTRKLKKRRRMKV